MKKNRILPAVVAAFAAFALTGCSANLLEGQTNAGRRADPYIALMTKSEPAAFWQAFAKGAQAEGQKLRAQVTVEDARSVPQPTQLINAFSRNVQVVGIAALHTSSVAPLLDEAHNVGIPVIAFGSGVKGDHALLSVSTDNSAAGATDAKHLAGLLGNTGTVGIVSAGGSFSAQRENGFSTWFKQNAPTVEVLRKAVQPSGVAALLKKHPNLTGVFGADQSSAVAIARALPSGSKVVAVGFDAGKSQVHAVQDGTLAGSVSRCPAQIGKAVVDTAVQFVDGGDPKGPVDVPFQWYDSSDLNTAAVSHCIYR